jgi:iron complex transport system ATP-binding protein
VAAPRATAGNHRHLDETHPEVASILVTHHLEELPTTTTHALLIAEGRTVARVRAREP